MFSFKSCELVKNYFYENKLKNIILISQARSGSTFATHMLSKYIGFHPNIISENDPYLCLESGTTSKIKPSGGSINGEDLKLFKKLLGMKFEALNTISISRESRTRILKKIINYYSLHLQMFKTPKSINVFAEVFK